VPPAHADRAHRRGSAKLGLSRSARRPHAMNRRSPAPRACHHTPSCRTRHRRGPGLPLLAHSRAPPDCHGPAAAPMQSLAVATVIPPATRRAPHVRRPPLPPPVPPRARSVHRGPLHLHHPRPLVRATSPPPSHLSSPGAGAAPQGALGASTLSSSARVRLTQPVPVRPWTSGGGAALPKPGRPSPAQALDLTLEPRPDPDHLDLKSRP
jgi:hypothetical protein